MKKKWLVALVVMLSIVLLCCTGCSLGKSTARLPALEELSEMSEADVNSLLLGYRMEQLIEVWGEPDVDEPNGARWRIGDVTLTVSYRPDDVVAVCGLKTKAGASVE